jgi:FMN phosphatase YigB (HAD superfamily)
VQVLTFDFHNTLANCDPWFYLEIRDLPWAVIERLDLEVPVTGKRGIDGAYRQVRLDVIASGNEIDAYDSVMHIFDQFQVRADRAAVCATIDQLMEASLVAMEPVPGAVETVEHLHKMGVRLGVVSSAVHHKTLDWILDRIGLAPCFDVVVTSASCGYYKSTTAIYDFALRKLHGDPASSVHVCDSLKWDVTTSQLAGLNAVWLHTPRREAYASEVTGPVPSLTLSSMVDAGPLLIDLLDQVRTPLNV